MKKFLKSLLIGLVAFVMTASVNAQYACVNASGEVVPDINMTPKTWNFVGFFENKASQGYAAIAGNNDWKTMGFVSGSVYSVTTETLSGNSILGSAGFYNTGFDFITEVPSNVSITVDVILLGTGLTNGQQVLFTNLPVGTGSSSGTWRLDEKVTNHVSIPQHTNPRLKFVFKTTSTDQNTDYFLQIDNVNVCVPQGFTSNNVLPTVSAGADQTITVGSSVTLSGSASDANGGYITLYEWQCVSNNFQYYQQGGSLSSVTINNLPVGTYTFRLTATDNDYGSKSDDVIVTVQAASTPTNIFGSNTSAYDVYVFSPASTSYIVSSQQGQDMAYEAGTWTFEEPNGFSVTAKFYNSSNTLLGTFQFWGQGMTYTLPTGTSKIVFE
jgi:hypothetical protein